jgi:hypothetical protein
MVGKIIITKKAKLSGRPIGFNSRFNFEVYNINYMPGI